MFQVAAFSRYFIFSFVTICFPFKLPTLCFLIHHFLWCPTLLAKGFGNHYSCTFLFWKKRTELCSVNTQFLLLSWKQIQGNPGITGLNKLNPVSRIYLLIISNFRMFQILCCIVLDFDMNSIFNNSLCPQRKKLRHQVNMIFSVLYLSQRNCISPVVAWLFFLP